ncbi:MAG: molybdopterin cofactor-binding domain-containing protein [Acidimicrobiales bacterium]
MRRHRRPLFRNQRLAPCPLEPRATIAQWGTTSDGRPHLSQWSSTQGAHGTRDTLARATGVSADQVRVICPDVGGGFGAKNGGYPEDIIVALVARQLDKPIRWVETRTESMLGLVHGRGCDFTATIGGSRDGTVTHYRVHNQQDAGAYPNVGAILPIFTQRMATGVYAIPNVEVSFASFVTNTVPVGAYRGAGRPEAAHSIERMMDAFAAEIGLDPSEVRRRNFIAPDAFPYTSATGTEMDSGEYAKALDAVLAAADYPALRAEQARRINDPSAPLLGLGWSAYVEIANPMADSEFGSIEINTDGSATVLTGSSSHGQGHHTAFAQLAAELTGIDIDKIDVRHGDTDEVPRGGGTGGSKSLQIGGSAVWQASEAVVETAKGIAAQLLEANPADVVLDTSTGTFSVAGTPAIAKTWAEISTFYNETASAPLRSEADFQPPGATFPFGVHLSVVEVDREIGEVTILRHICCDDAGVIVNPMIVEGQVHGGVASGIAQALVEEFVYDDSGNPLTANFLNYALVSAAELPSFERLTQQTPTPKSAWGKGHRRVWHHWGDASGAERRDRRARPSRVRHVDIPTTAERVWRALNDAPGA